MNPDQTSVPNLTPSPSARAVQHICMLIYPGMTALDFIAPQLVFANLGNVEVLLAWRDKEPVVTDSGVALLPTVTFDEVPMDLEVLFVPGGRSFELLIDPEVLAFLRSRGERAGYVTSVCTGSLLLGAAGLLDGYRATSHWRNREQLRQFGAIPTLGRVVQDRNRFTGGGVTAGLDFGLVLAAELRGESHARLLQLIFEYDPQPPFDSGSPEKAGDELVNRFKQMAAGTVTHVELLINQATQYFQEHR